MLFNNHFKQQFDHSVMECNACKFKDSPGPVLGYGGVNAEVMFVGDVAKESDIAAGIPFTGIAKKRMTDVIEATGLKKGEYYLTYLIKHTLPKGTNLNMMESQPCLDHLLREIELLNPRIICSMGYFATKYLMQAYNIENKNKSMNDIHGTGCLVPAKASYKTKYKKNVAYRPKRYLIPTWSPAVDNSLMNRQMMKDVKTVKDVLSFNKLLLN